MGNISELIFKVLIVGCGSFLGGILRYLVSLVSQNLCKSFPWGTLIVNLLGCFLIGCLTGLFTRSSQSQYLNLFLIVGFCGGFTTFSTFSKECFNMFQAGDFLHLIIYLLICLLVGVFLVFLGLKISGGCSNMGI